MCGSDLAGATTHDPTWENRASTNLGRAYASLWNTASRPVLMDSPEPRLLCFKTEDPSSKRWRGEVSLLDSRTHRQCLVIASVPELREGSTATGQKSGLTVFMDTSRQYGHCARETVSPSFLARSTNPDTSHGVPRVHASAPDGPFPGERTPACPPEAGTEWPPVPPVGSARRPPLRLT